MTEISYHHVREFPGWAKAPDFLRTLIGDYQPRILLEIGSGANPTLDLEAAQKSGLRYITSDSSEAELAKGPVGSRPGSSIWTATISRTISWAGATWFLVVW